MWRALRATSRVGIAGVKDVRKGGRGVGFCVLCGDFQLKDSGSHLGVFSEAVQVLSGGCSGHGLEVDMSSSRS